jgi:hypothetical protein
MTTFKLSTDSIFAKAVEHNGNLASTAEALGMKNRSSVWSRLKKAGKLEELRERTRAGTNAFTSAKEKIDVRPRGDFTDVDYLGSKIQTEEELLKAAGIDMEFYEIERCTVNNWEVAGTKSKAEWDGVWKTGLRQIKITLRRKKNDQLSVESILARIESASPIMLAINYPKRAKSVKYKRALEVSIMDPHYGMQCFKGDSDHSWGLEECEKLCLWSIDKLIERAEPHGPFDEIVFPLGNDFMHHDNMEHTTTRGTNQPEGLPYMYVYERAIQLAVTMVERLAELAPVKVIQVSGNHDHVTAFTLGHVLNAYYRNDPNVNVDVSPSPYKFWNFGTNLVGFDHGHHVKPARLAALMAHECVNLWATTAFREWHLGDQHRKGTGKPVTMEEQGVGVEYLPALTPPNAWHRLKAFNWQQRGAMGFVWDHNEGPLARLQVNLNSYTGKPMGE